MESQVAYSILQYDSETTATKPLILKLAGRYENCTSHYLPTRTMNEFVLLYVTAGTGWVNLCGTKTTVSKGDIIIFPANSPHSYGNLAGGSWSLLWFHFTGMYGDYFYNLTSAEKNAGVIRDAITPAIFELFQTLILAIEHMNNLVDLIHAQALLTTILCDISKSVKQIESKSSPQKVYVDKAIYLLESSKETISLEELAKSVGISKYYLIKLFKEFTNTTPKEYLNTIKLKRACKLLKETNLSILEISISLGFSNQYHFSKNFKQFSGYSPTQFRKLV